MSLSYQLITDVTCDLPKEYFKEHSISCIYLKYEIDGKTYSGDEISEPEFYKAMRSGSQTKTAQCTPDEFEKSFEPFLKAGKDIIYISFSSGLSGTYNSSRLAAETLSVKYPDRKIFLCDSLCASLGEGLLVDYAVKKRDMGATIDELYEWLEKNKLHLCHMFTVDDLKYLFRGGRVSRTAAIAGTILGIKPVLHVDNEGHLVPVAKVRGRKASLNMLIDAMGEKGKGHKNKTIAICHGDCLADAQYVATQVKQRFGYEACIINYTGKVIGAHSGPGTLALFFMGDVR